MPRRALDVEDYVDILRRHWTWIVGPTFAGLVISVVVAFLWPDTYLSYAVMRITPSQVSDRIVPTNFNLHMQDRMATMLQDVTSRSKLIDMIKKFNLYPSEQAKRPLEDIVEDMRLSVKIDPIESTRSTQQKSIGSAFRIAFQYQNRNDAQKVVQEMVNAFMSQNVIDRRAKSRITTEFLSEEVKTAKANLDTIENELIAFKQRNAGRLPEELQSNLQMQNSYQQQLNAVQEVLNRNQQDRMMLETSLQNLKSQLNTVEVAEVEAVAKGRTEVKSERLAEAEKRVSDAESSLAVLREQLLPGHPDLKNAIARVETIKQERDKVAAQVAAEEERAARRAPVQTAPVKRVNPLNAKNRVEIESQIKTTQARIHAFELDSEERVKMQKQIFDNLRQISDRIQANPSTQGEYARLTRDYNLAKERYDHLSGQKSSSEVANRLEDRSAGENLEVLDPASLPQKPSEPNRWIIVGAGTVIGLVLGLFLAGAQEVKDSTMKGLKDVRAYSNLNILSSIPLLENALLVRRKRRLTWLAWSSAVIVGVVVMSGSVYYYFWGR
ncbi:MAG TPA: GNVR domain-containing protein [Bryobacteraceae bacterium]|nr:GNVR domain-containing protein [Bryobacteraceae bacterium]